MSGWLSESLDDIWEERAALAKREQDLADMQARMDKLLGP